MRPVLLAMLLAAAPAAAEGPLRWSVGAGVAARTQPYAGDGGEVRPIPFVAYRGERLTVQGPRAEYLVKEIGPARLSAEASPLFGAFDADDSPALAGMDRSATLELGGSVSASLPYGLGLEIGANADVLGIHGGASVRARLAKRTGRGPWSLAPSVGLEWESPDRAAYAYGVEAGEAAAGRPAYRPGAALHATAGLFAGMPAPGRLQAMLGLSYRRLDAAAGASPIIDDRDMFGLLFGLFRSF